MQRYEKYKPSRIEWIGEIPEHWGVLKYKRLFSVSSGDFLLKEHETFDEEKYPVYGGNGQRGYAKVYNNHGPMLLIGRVGAKCGNIHLVDNKYWVSEHALRVLPKKEFNLSYFKFLLELNNFNQFAIKTAQPLINSEIVTDQYTIKPKIAEQTAIANYLDSKTAEIDDLIAKKEKLLELYEEEKTAIINELVTGKKVWNGIDWAEPAEVKDSGIEWLGEIPANWEMGKFNHYIFLRHGYQFRDYDFTPTGIKVIKITQLLNTGKLETENVSFIDENRLADFEDILIKEGDILMALTGGTIGKIIRVNTVNEPLLQNYRVGNFFPLNKKITKDFLFWILSSELILKQIFYDQRETGQPNIGKDNFSRMFIAIPQTIEEQTAIVAHIEKESTRIDAKIAKTKKLIELLKEYRTALISEAVTGKIKVFENDPKYLNN